ncbi:MAG: hypothetical protein IPM16_16305 [Chloroflexi bacterium]|nr:hypothetical protein [Chloroflexota bacterium]
MFNRIALCLVTLLVFSLPVYAQNSAPTLTSDAEYDIGFDCPVSAALSPDGQSLWVLMDNCGGYRYSLRAFNVSDGAPLDVGDFSAELEPLELGYVDSFVVPLAFISDTVLSVRYSDSETYDLRSLQVDISGGAAPVSPFLADQARTDLVRSVTEYAEYAVNSPDHSLVVAASDTAFHIFDLRGGAEILTIDSDLASFGAYAWFSDDAATVYIATLDEPDNFDNFNATLVAYSLPDGAITAEYAVPSPFLTVSPDGRYAVAQAGSADGEESTLWVVDLRSGTSSEVLSMYEDPKPATRCLNRQSDLSDVNFRISGKLSVSSVTWFPDSTRFLVTRSYGGEGVGGGLPCYLNYSRLNAFSVGP